MTLRAWVLGGRGLLGAHLELALKSELGAEVFCAPPFEWEDTTRLAAQLDAAARELARVAAGDADARWIVAWAAGAGVVGTSAVQLAAETAALAAALAAVERHVAAGGARGRGALFIASSAGGVYGNNFQQPLDESSQPSPISDYGRNKLVQEDQARAWAARTGTRLLVGRLANLYGPGQKLDKPQGFISQLSRSMIFHRPVHVFVPLDTRRDFLYVTDCAQEVARALGRLVDSDAAAAVTKIFASERTVSLARVVGIFTRLVPHHPRVICAPQPVAALQPRALQYRSAIWREEAPRRTDLVVGIERVHAHNLALHRAGRLPP